MTTDPPAVTRASCVCCETLGRLPADVVRGAFGQVLERRVAGDVLERMCPACVAGKFAPGPQLCPHPTLDGIAP